MTRMAEAEIERAMAMYASGSVLSTIAAELGRDSGTISRNLKKAGVVLKAYRDYHAAKVFETYFEVIDSPAKAYWLGYLAADGCVSESAGDYRAFHFNIQRRDRVALEQFKAAVGYSGEIRDYERVGRRTGKTHRKSGIDFNNKLFCGHLISKGWFEFKRQDNPTRLLGSIPADLMRHFVRGFFDGDGCISRRRKSAKSYYVAFSGSEQNLAAIGGIVSVAVGLSQAAPKKAKTNSFRLRWNGRRQVVAFGEWIYADSLVHLERKRDRFAEAAGIPAIVFDEQNRFCYPLSYAEISRLTDERKASLADHFLRAVSNRTWVSPSYDGVELLTDYQMVKDDDPGEYCAGDSFRSSGGSGASAFAGRKLLTHFQPHYWDTRYRTHKTLVEGWSDDKIRHKAVHNLFFTRGSRPSLPRFLRELNFAGARRVSHFHPVFAKAILLRFCPQARSMLDPCAGWGARLLAASALGLEYTACDPNHKTVAGLHSMAEFVGSDPRLLNIPFERFEPSGRFDIAFTSPPYFNIEKYEYGEQSYLGKPNYKSWYYGFLAPLVNKCLGCCDMVVLHVSERIKDSLLRTYPNSQAVAAMLQRSPGAPRSAEYVVLLKT